MFIYWLQVELLNIFFSVVFNLTFNFFLVVIITFVILHCFLFLDILVTELTI